MFSHLFRNISMVCPRYRDEFFRFIGIIVNHLRIFIKSINVSLSHRMMRSGAFTFLIFSALWHVSSHCTYNPEVSALKNLYMNSFPS